MHVDVTLCIYISSTNILGKQTKALEAEARGGVKTEAETPDGAGDTKASEAPFPPEPRRLVPKQPTYPPPGYKPVPQQPPAQPSVPQPKTPPSNHDLLQQQHMLAQHVHDTAMREQAQKYSMHCMPQFTGPAALDMQETWLLQQQDIMRQQQTSFLIQQEQQRMDFLMEQQRQYELQQQAVQLQQKQTGAAAGTAAAASFQSLGGPMQEAMSIQEESRHAFLLEQERQLREQNRKEEMEKMERERLEQERLEQERLEQQRMQDEADRALEEERLRIEEEEHWPRRSMSWRPGPRGFGRRWCPGPAKARPPWEQPGPSLSPATGQKMCPCLRCPRPSQHPRSTPPLRHHRRPAGHDPQRAV